MPRWAPARPRQRGSSFQGLVMSALNAEDSKVGAVSNSLCLTTHFQPDQSVSEAVTNIHVIWWHAKNAKNSASRHQGINALRAPPPWLPAPESGTYSDRFSLPIGEENAKDTQ